MNLSIQKRLGKRKRGKSLKIKKERKIFPRTFVRYFIVPIDHTSDELEEKKIPNLHSQS